MVVERILASTADSEAGAGSGSSAAASVDSLTALEAAAAGKAGPAPLPPVHGGLAAGIAALHTGGGAAGGSPRSAAKRSTFSVAAAAGPGAAAAAGTEAAAAAAPPQQKQPPPQQQQPQQLAGGREAGVAAEGAEEPQIGRLWSGAAAGLPRAGTLADGQRQAEAEAEEELLPAEDPCGELLLHLLDEQQGAAAGAAAAPLTAGGHSRPLALATVAEDAAAVEASAQSRHEAAEVGSCCWAGWPPLGVAVHAALCNAPLHASPAGGAPPLACQHASPCPSQPPRHGLLACNLPCRSPCCARRCGARGQACAS